MMYQSESDFPIEEIKWSVKADTTIADVAKDLGHAKKNTKVLAPDVFSDAQSDPNIKATVTRLKEQAPDLSLFKTEIGDCIYDLLLIGKSADTEVVGLRTKSVET